jgi:hypothetical protein
MAPRTGPPYRYAKTVNGQKVTLSFKRPARTEMELRKAFQRYALAKAASDPLLPVSTRPGS